MAKPEFVAWYNDQMSRAVLDEHREIRMALIRKCVAGDLDAIKFWHEIYGEYIPTQRQILDRQGERDITELTNGELSEIARILAATGAKGTGPSIQ